MTAPKAKRLLGQTKGLARKGEWFRFPWPGLGTVFVRCAEVDGRSRAVELYVDGGGEPIQPGALRQLPVGLVEHEAAIHRDRIAKLRVPYVNSGDSLNLSQSAADHFAFVELHRAFLPSDRESTPSVEPDFALAAPQDGLTDSFLADVGKAYRVAVQRRTPPATELARQAGVSVRTAQSWIYKARKRGLMPPATHRGRIV